ncbi:MAG: hypothetical protein V4529_12060 [Gemmatimonadota bacterium]
MMQDRAIKGKVLRFAVAKRWFPQVEVDVIPTVSTSATSDKPITDIDVMALVPDPFVGFRKVLVDCKTKKSESPIARTLWLSGLMGRVGAVQGVCILKRARVEPDHRFYAAQYGVLLLTDDEFDEYAQAMGAPRSTPTGFVGDIEFWEMLFEIASRYRNLAPAVEFIRRGYWQSTDSAEACRRTIVQLTKIAGEVDPSIPSHHALFGSAVALFLHALTGVVNTIFAGYLRPETKDQLSAALLLIFFGGREAYLYKNTIAKLFHEQQNPGRKPPDLAPPNWDGFLQLVRHCLDAPSAVAHGPLLVLETGFAQLRRTDADSHHDEFASMLSKTEPHAAKFGILAGEYLQRAAGLPKEFSHTLTSHLI